jgi:hypothetical protein
MLDFYIFDFFSRNVGPVSTKAGRNHPQVKGIKYCSNVGPPPSARGDNYTKNFVRNPVLNHWAREAQIYVNLKAS